MFFICIIIFTITILYINYVSGSRESFIQTYKTDLVNAPRFWKISNFMMPHECDQFIKECEFNQYFNTKKTSINQLFIKNCSFLEAQTPFINKIENRIAKAMNVPINRLEGLSVSISKPKEFPAQAMSDLTNDSNQIHMSAIIFLNEDFEDGEIFFPNLKIHLKPQKGEMIMWNNCDPPFFVNGISTEGSNRKWKCYQTNYINSSPKKGVKYLLFAKSHFLPFR